VLSPPSTSDQTGVVVEEIRIDRFEIDAFAHLRRVVFGKPGRGQYLKRAARGGAWK